MTTCCFTAGGSCLCVAGRIGGNLPSIPQLTRQDTVTVGSHMRVTGPVKRILANGAVLNDKGQIVMEKLRPIICDEEQTRCLSLGDKIADAFKTGMALKKTLEDKEA